MAERLLHVAIRHETDVVLARQRTRQLAEALGFDKQDQTRITTAVSEIARNAFEYGGGGRAEYFLIGDAPPQLLEIVITDSGPGIEQIAQILRGAHRSQTGMGLGILGAQRLMDQLSIDTKAGVGTSVKLRKMLPFKSPLVTPQALGRLTRQLTEPSPFDPLAEIRRQNQELLVSLQESRKQHEELSRLNQELEDTNRGVVALYAELDERADHLRHTDELKSRFLSNMSHEFRTPLNSIVALSRLLLDRTDGSLSADQEKQITFIRKAAENLTELVNDLLDLAKVEAGKVEVRPVEFSMENLFGTLRGMLRPLLADDRVGLIFEDVADIPEIYSDESKVAQILRNFISNAIKFTEYGEVRVFARALPDATMLICVRDTGVGIAPENHDKIFQEFVQLENSAQKNHQGTGLGLPLSKKLAELLGGKIELTSAVGEGSTFSLHLPLAYRNTMDSTRACAAGAAPPEGIIPVLLLENNAAGTSLCERTLAGTRFSLLRVPTVAEARQALERIRPAAILLDPALGEDSWKFLAALKQTPDTQDIPLIVVSSVDDEAKARALGVDHCMCKPVSRVALLEALTRLINHGRRTRVLLIEDEEAFRYVIRQFLPSGTYEIIEAHTGAEGLRAAYEASPDIVLLDINLPEMSGFELLNHFASSIRIKDVPVIIVSAQMIEERHTSRLSSVRKVISKRELSTEILTSSIQEALSVSPPGGCA